MKTIACGSGFSLAVSTEGELFAWGIGKDVSVPTVTDGNEGVVTYFCALGCTACNPCASHVSWMNRANWVLRTTVTVLCLHK